MRIHRTTHQLHFFLLSLQNPQKPSSLRPVLPSWGSALSGCCCTFLNGTYKKKKAENSLHLFCTTGGACCLLFLDVYECGFVPQFCFLFAFRDETTAKEVDSGNDDDGGSGGGGGGDDTHRDREIKTDTTWFDWVRQLNDDGLVRNRSRKRVR